jgi:MFS family permease
MAFIDSTVTNVALPQIQDHLGATAADSQWIVESYALFLSALILVGGSLGDHFGRRRIFSLGIVVFTLASVWCGFSTSAEMLIVARAVQGVGGAMLVPGSLAIISASFDGDDRGKAMGTWSGLSGVTTALGPVLGGFLIGPVIAAAFVLFALPGTGGSYWTTFFPAIVVLGFGMALVIAPLRTTARNSVSGRHSGLASGVNNAVSRTAGLLAIPVLGIFVLLVFSGGLDARVQSLDLSPQAKKQLEAEKVNLGGAQAPPGVSKQTEAKIEHAIVESFRAGFRLAMFIAAGLAVASALAAALIMEGKGSTTKAERTGQLEGETVPA